MRNYFDRSLYISKPCSGVSPSCTTALTAWIIAAGFSDWNTLRPVVNGFVAEFEGLFLFEFLAAGDHDGYRAGVHHFGEAVAVVGLHDIGPVFGAHARSQAEVFGVAGHIFAHGGNAHCGNAVFVSGVCGTDEVFNGLGFEFVVAHGHHHGHRRSVHAHGVHRIEHAFVVQVGQDRRPGRITQADTFVIGRRHHRTQRAAGAHQRVGVLDQRHDVQVQAFQAGGRPHDIPVVESEHHGTAGAGPEDPREAVFHPPVEVIGPFYEIVLVGHRNPDAVVFVLVFKDPIHVCHVFFCSYSD